MTRRRHAAAGSAAVLLGLLLGGCASAPPPPSGALAGRLAVRVDASPARIAQSFAATFELRGGADAGELRLSSPLGTMLAAARWSGSGAWLQTADGETAYADLDALSRAALGEALPLRALPDWLHGRPWPGAPSRAVDAGFEQLDWRVSLAGYGEGRVDALRLAPAPAVSVRALIDRP